MTVFSMALIVCIFLLTLSLQADMKNFGKGLLDVRQTLILMSNNAFLPADSKMEIGDLEKYAAAIRSQFGDQSVEINYPRMFRQLHFEGRSFSLSTLTEDELNGISDVQLIDGSWPTADQQAVVTKTFIAITGKNLGESLLIYGSEFQIAGIVTSEKLSSAVIFLPYRQAEDLYNANGIFQLGFIQLSNSLDADLVQRFLTENQKNELCCSVYQDDHFVTLYRNTVQGIRFLAGVIQMIALLLIIFGTYNSSALVINEHNHEIVLLRMVGFSNITVMAILFLRLTIINLFAYLSGLLLAYGYSLWQQTNIRLAISGNPINLQITLVNLLIGAFLVFFSSSLGIVISMRNQNNQKLSTGLQNVFSGRIG
jgi:ABC-type antimicrobial peptide transport system permease subunit